MGQQALAIYYFVCVATASSQDPVDDNPRTSHPRGDRQYETCFDISSRFYSRQATSTLLLSNQTPSYEGQLQVGRIAVE